MSHAFHPHRRRCIKLLATVGLTAAVGRVLAAEDHPQGIRSMNGTVLINGKPAQLGQVVRAGDTVATASGSDAVYVIGDNALLQREKSTVQLGEDVAKNFFRLVTGKVLAVFGRGEKQLALPAATIGIRGTACYLEHAEGKPAYFCLCYGAAQLTPAANAQKAEHFLTRHHDHPVLIGSDPATPVTDVPGNNMSNHADDELRLLEGLVGRHVPFGKVG